MNLMRCRLFALLIAIPLLSAVAHAQPQSSKSAPIRWIVAGAPGSSLDLIARVLQPNLNAALGQAIIIDNRPSAGGTVAANEVAKSAPDGNTWLLGFNGPLAFAPHLYPDLPYQPLRDLQPVVLTTSQPNLIAVSRDFPANNLRELIAVLRAAPGTYAYASVGNGSSSHLTMEYLKSLTGTSILHVPFNGGGIPALQAVESGDVQIFTTVPTTIMPRVTAGKMKTIAVTGKTRYPLLPQVPTVAQSGVPGLADFEAIAWNGVLVAAGTPRAAVLRIAAAINTALQERAIRARLAAAGLTTVGGSPEQFAKLIASESEKWAPVIKQSGAKID